MKDITEIIKGIAARVIKVPQKIECTDCGDKGLIFVDIAEGCTVFRCTCKAGMAQPKSIPFATFEGEDYSQEEVF